MSSWLSSSGQIQPSVGEADQRANLAGDHGRGVCKTVCNLAGLLWYYITTSHPFLRQFRQDSAVPPLTEGIDHPSECSSSERRACPFKRHDTNAGAECRLAERQHIANQCQYGFLSRLDQNMTWKGNEDKLWDFWAHNLRQPQTLTAFQERVSSTSFVCYLSRLCFRGTMLKGMYNVP